MSATVWKFPLQVTDHQKVEMPRGASILYIAAQFEQPCIWALCNTTAPKVWRTFATVGTGHPAPELNEGRHVGSYMLRNGNLVFHVFEPTHSSEDA
jgi:hypothetical protein